MPLISSAAGAEFLDLFALQPGPEGLDAYLQRVVATAAQWFEADDVTLYLRAGDSHTYVLGARHRKANLLLPSACFVEGQGVAGMAAASGVARVLQGRLEDGKESLDESLIIAPLMIAPSKCVGVMVISRDTGRRQFGEEDLKTAGAVSQHLALAVSNATLVAQLEASAAAQSAIARQLEAILENLNAGVVATDASGRVVRMNQRLIQMLHLDGESSLSWEVITSALSPNAALELEMCLQRALDGTPSSSWVEEPTDQCLVFRASPIPGGGVVVFIEDITREVQRERELERSKRLAEAGQLTAAIAHEIRNPLTAIIGAAQILRGESTMEKMCKWGLVIEEEARGLDRLCNEFLEFARVPHVAPEQARLNELIIKVMERMQPDFENAGIFTTFEPEAGEIVINVDSHKLKQVLRNLFKNAIEATQPGGRVTVRTFTDGERVTLSITDTGHGISKEDLDEKLFTPFFTTKSQGTGLGLCNVRKIVEAHGGTINATSKRGEGSTFVISLPIGERAA